MPKKLKSGDYKCKFCGKVFSTSNKVKDHESTCLENNLTHFLGSKVENIVHLKPSGRGKTEYNQLKLDQNLVGSCFNCDSNLTTSDRMKPDSELFECTVCGNINRLEV